MIEQLRQQLKQEALAEADAQAQRDNARQAKRARRKSALTKLSPRAIINMPRFTLILTVWGAALLGLSVLALSSVDIARANMILGLGALGHAAKFLYAAIAAVIGAAGAFAVAWALVRFFGQSSSRGPVAALAGQRVRPIDRDELGSESLDAPIEDTRFIADEVEDSAAPIDEPSEDEETASEEEVLDLESFAEFDETEEGALEEPLDEAWIEPEDTQDDIAVEQVAEEDEPIVPSAPGLNIDAFRDILDEENRKAKALEDEARAKSAAAVTSIAPPASGIEKLRQVPPQDLSLIQLVERFAAALHDAQDRSPHELISENLARETASREHALAEALKALDVFTDGGHRHEDAETASISETERDLQDALVKLQSLRGAA
ncbi:MAG: hypothetical protein AAFQ34_04990 [Pseudomonadota bacterium]